MADATYLPGVYRERGGDRFVVASSGSLDIESGGEIDLESGSSLKIAGTSVTASAAELNIMTGVTATAAELNLTDGQVASIAWTLAATGTTAQKNADIQLKDAAGTVISGNRLIKVFLFADSAGAAFVSPTSAMALSTGTNAATCALVVESTSLPQVTAWGIASTSGLLSVKLTDTGKTACYIGAVLPNGSYSISTGAFTTT